MSFIIVFPKNVTGFKIGEIMKFTPIVGIVGGLIISFPVFNMGKSKIPG
jgi:hypothetical protein